ncbi:MAG: hypothetical protein IKT27_00870 [Clostridia bacterium]|nr:hypothetical protein [Clostridia bacterium]
MLTEKDKEDILRSLLKKAVGFEVEEVSEEFARDSLDGSEVLVKRKVNRHYVQPDLNALKTLLSLLNVSFEDSLEGLSLEELLKEKEVLISAS